MVDLVPFRAEHLAEIELQAAQQYVRHLLDIEAARALEGPQAWTVRAGRVLLCGGVTELWPGRGLLWSYVAKDIKARMVGVTRVAQRFLDLCPYVRIEAYVDCEFAAGHRWMHLLGFSLEAPRMRKHGVDGRDEALYARVR